jgi:hypothetical protein
MHRQAVTKSIIVLILTFHFSINTILSLFLLPLGMLGGFKFLSLHLLPFGEAGRGFSLLPHLLQQTVGMSPTVHHEEHVADVNTDATSELRVEEDITRERVPVAIESQSDETVLTIEHR